jgi:hypothetical protein
VRRPSERVGPFRFGAVLLMTLALALFALLALDGRGARGVELLGAGATLVFAVATSNAPVVTRRVASIGLAVVVGGLAVDARFGGTHPALTLGVTAVVLAATALIVLVGLIRLIVERGVVLQAVLAALAVYLLVGLGFGFAAGAIAVGESGSYFAQGTDGTQAIRVYFSFTVLTTTGFGDYTAASRAGRALTVLEMLMGQLYLVTVISLLVGNLRGRPDMGARLRRPPPSGDG